MSEILAKVQNLQNVENLHIITLESTHNIFKMMSLDLHKNLKISTEVKLNIKPSSIAIAKGVVGELSYSNQLSAKIISIELGELLTCIILDIKDTKLESIITTSSAKRMALKVDDRVRALIKSSDLSILDIL